MTIEQLYTLYNARPFQPFVIHLEDGRQIPVRSPEFMGISPRGRSVVVFQPDDSMDIVDLFLVTDLEVKRASGGGRKQRREP
jgi:hypothetical protein